MFEILRKNKIKKIANDARAYVMTTFICEAKSVHTVGSAIEETHYSDRDVGHFTGDRYDGSVINAILRQKGLNLPNETSKRIENSINLSFSDTLVCYISAKKLNNTKVYKDAQIDRRLFSKIISDRLYKPRKDTCIALAFALKLTKDEAIDFISRAGYTLSHSIRRDVIIEYFFNNKIYNLYDINEVLEMLGETVIG